MTVVVPIQPAEARSPLRHVFIVGAGFSRAIGEVMPTLDQLGAKIADDLKARPSFQLLPKTAQTALMHGSIPGGDLEGWLTMLASPPPFVSEAEAHFNAGIFSEIASVIAEVIEACELEVLKTTPTPVWLHRLVRCWNAVGATVITFNYDTLIEHAASLISPTGDRWPNVAFRLLKVHGSTNWRARGDGASSPEVLPLLPGWGTADVPREPLGDERVLVPPVAAKGSYYEPSFIRREWQQARLALERASKLYIVGYRLPANDLATTTLVSHYLATDAEIALVNLDPIEPSSVLKKIGRPALHNIPGASCVATMVGVYEREIGLELLPTFIAKVEAIPDDPPLDAVTADPDPMRAIIDIREEPDRIVLIACEAPFRWEDAEVAVRLSRLRRALKEKLRPIVVQRAGEERPTLALSVMDAWPHGNQLARWVTLEG
jgi:hypothetical protein